MAYTYLHCHGQQIFGLSIHTPCCSRLIKLGEFRNYKGWPQASVLDRKLRRVVGVLHVCYLLPCWSSLQAWGLTQMSILLELSFHQILLEGQTFVHLIFISNFGRRIFILLPVFSEKKLKHVHVFNFSNCVFCWLYELGIEDQDILNVLQTIW